MKDTLIADFQNVGSCCRHLMESSQRQVDGNPYYSTFVQLIINAYGNYKLVRSIIKALKISQKCIWKVQYGQPNDCSDFVTEALGYRLKWIT